MKVEIGEEGLDTSWQEEFTKKVKCEKCGSNARIAFVAFEDEATKNWVCRLHPNTKRDKGGKFWVHDAIACAVYLCEKCCEPTAILNQA